MAEDLWIQGKEDEDMLKKDFFEKSLACQEKILYIHLNDWYIISC
ncbi:hypothetical protein ACOBMG_06835 [Limosilactobacillus mucosae]